MKELFSFFFTTATLFFYNAPSIFAQSGSVGGNPSNPGTVGGNPSNPGSVGGNPPNGSLSLQNPLGNKDIFDLLSDLLEVIMVFAVPLIVFMIIYAGFLYVTAQGNPGQVGKAHKALLYAVVGGVIILGAWVIIEVIQGTVDAFR